MKSAVGPPACTIFAPGQVSCTAVMAARISVLLTTAVPAGVTGAVAPRIGIG